MIHSSWVWLAGVLRTRPGIGTFTDAIAAATAPRAIQTTTVTIVLPAGRPLVRAWRGMACAPLTKESSFLKSNGDDASAVKREYSFCLVIGWCHAQDHRGAPGGPARAGPRGGARLPARARPGGRVDGDDHRPLRPVDRRRLRLLQGQGRAHQRRRDRGNGRDGAAARADPAGPRAAAAARAGGSAAGDDSGVRPG